MDNTFLYPDSVNIFQKELNYRIDYIEVDNSNVREVFYANLINYIYNVEIENIGLSILSGVWTNQKIYNVFLQGNLLIYDYTDYSSKSPVHRFSQREKRRFQNEKSEKSVLYLEFIANNEEIFKRIDWLVNNKNFRHYKINFKTFAQHSINVNLINEMEIEKEIKKYFRILFVEAAKDLILFSQFQKENKEEVLAASFDFEYYLYPALLVDKEELNRYRKAIINWSNYIFKEIRRKIGESFNPPLYRYYIDKIENIIDEKSFPGLVPVLTKEVVVNDYPRYIFSSHKAYVLFNSIAQELDSHTQISFLFRQMSEKENPPLIVVHNNQFVKWFNEQQYRVDLDYTTKTYLQSANSERIAYYKIIKSLIFRD